jgi:hypothetical protein
MTSSSGPVDWGRVDRCLCENYGKSPDEVDRMTFSEIAVLCMPADEKGGPPGGHETFAEMKAKAAAFLADPAAALERVTQERGW